MKYEKVLRATFLERPNRFIAYARLEGERVVCHVKNTGRCRELLVPGAEVVLSDGRDNAKRKTPFDLIAVKKGDRLINIDSQAPNAAAAELLRRLYPDAVIRPEKAVGDSRIDFYLENGEEKMFVEVKGVTLEENGAVFFPDAPTQRGIKHLRELTSLKEQGYTTKVLFIVQTEKVRYFAPNRKTHPQFADELIRASEAGVDILAYECRVTEGEMVATVPVEIRLY